ncbi:MAG TPA: ABC transporter ATP-binding protein [Actinomycetota bacterium]|nr:ABC transporter ATP-binding protein [Actinomycetota bacterium]
MTSLLEVDGLGVTLEANGEPRPILTDVTFSIDAGETLGLVGESGSGKSMTARAIARLLPPGGTSSGRIHFDAVDVLGLTGADLRAYRAEDIAMVFQDPRAHTNPVRRIGDFLTESMRERGTPAADADGRARALLHEVGLEDAELMRRFPHEMSGGMLQRIMIAAALANEPRLLLADEPTTALDVTTQAEIIAILRRLQRSHALSVLFITHDLELAAATCDRICVMYAGTIVEVQRSDGLFRSPLHPYTAALLTSRPDIRLRERARDPRPSDQPVRGPGRVRLRAAMPVRTAGVP